MIILGYLLLSFIMTTMLAQLFPDERFPLETLGLVMLLGAVGAWLGHLYLSNSLITGALLGAGLMSGVLLLLLHSTGLLVRPLTPPRE